MVFFFLIRSIEDVTYGFLLLISVEDVDKEMPYTDNYLKDYVFGEGKPTRYDF